MSFASKFTLALCSVTSIGIIGYVHLKQQSDREKLRGGVLRDIEQQQMKKAQNLYVLEMQKNLEAKYKEAESAEKALRTLRTPQRQCKLKISDDSGLEKSQNERIYLRVAKILSGKLVTDEYPNGMSVEVNGRSVAIPHEWSGPLDISDLVRTQVGSTNQIIVGFTPYLTNHYVVTVFATKASTNSEGRKNVASIWDGMLLGEVHIQPPEITKKRILSYFSKSLEDDDVQVENLEVKLDCPLTLKRLTQPCLSRKCQHISCFDALGFLSLQSAVTKCPICGVRCRTEDLLTDGYWVEVLESIPNHCSKVTLKRDGSWCPAESSENPPTEIT